MSYILQQCEKHDGFLEGYCVPCSVERQQETENRVQQLSRCIPGTLQKPIGASDFFGVGALQLQQPRHSVMLGDMSGAAQRIETGRQLQSSGAMTFSEFAAMVKKDQRGAKKSVPEAKIITEELPHETFIEVEITTKKIDMWVK